MLPITSLCSALVMPLAAGMTALGAGAQLEVAAGQSPRTGLAEGEPALIGQLQLAAGAQFRARHDRTTLRYTPRLVYRPGTFALERPLLLHRLVAVQESELSRRLRLNFGANAVLGELEQGRAVREALGASTTRLDAASISVFSGAAFAGIQYELSRIAAMNFGLRGGYRTSTSVPVLPGLRASTDSRVPESLDVSLSVSYERSLSRRLALLVPLRAGFFWSEVVGSLGIVTFEPGLRHTLDRYTHFTAAAGATYAQLPPETSTNVPIFPSARLALARTFDENEARATTGHVTLRHDGTFDSLQGDYRPLASLEAQLTVRQFRWSISGSAYAAMVTSNELRENEARSNFGAELPVGYRVSNRVELAFGARASARSLQWPLGPLEPRQVEALVFFALRGVMGNTEDPGWVL